MQLDTIHHIFFFLFSVSSLAKRISSCFRLENEDSVDLFVKFKRQAIWIKEEGHSTPIKIIHP